jgi:hypothetical protein
MSYRLRAQQLGPCFADVEQPSDVCARCGYEIHLQHYRLMPALRRCGRLGDEQRVTTSPVILTVQITGPKSCFITFDCN